MGAAGTSSAQAATAGISTTSEPARNPERIAVSFADGMSMADVAP